MTLKHFTEVEVAAYLEPVGYPYVTGEDQNAPILRHLESFTEETRCNFDDHIGFTTSAASSFDFRDTSIFEAKILQIQNVWLEGELINQALTAADMALIMNGYQGQDPGTPSFWFTQAPTILRFDKELTGVLADSYVSGWKLHPAIGSEEAIQVPDTDIDAAAMFVSTRIMRPRATTGEVKTHRDSILKELAPMMEAILLRSKTTTAQVTKKRRSSPYRSIG